jgi:flagellar assembly factor FliW
MSLIIESRPFGKIEISEKQVITFPEGLLGFEDYTSFALIEENDETPFKWLQSLQEPDLAFVVIQPDLFLEEYKPMLTKEDLLEIDITDATDSLTFLIVTIPPKHPEEMTANLQGPVIINAKKKKAKQYISRNDSHVIRKRIIDAGAA